MRTRHLVLLLLAVAVLFAGCTSDTADTGDDTPTDGADGGADTGDSITTLEGSWDTQVSISKGDAYVFPGDGCPQTTVHFQDRTMDRVRIYEGTIDDYSRAKYTGISAGGDVDVHGYATMHVATVGDTTADIRLACGQ